MCSLRDAATDFEELGVKVYGASLDDVKSQAAFHEAQKLSFPLLSDPDGSLAAKCGVLASGARFTARKTLLIDPEGVLRHVDEKVDVAKHGSVLVDWIREHK
jgi:peroxiredoxin Q/BCP